MSRGSPARRDAPQPDAPTPTAFDKIGRAIAMWREERGVTQTRLADAAGLHRSQMSRYERARELPNLKALEKILAALEVAPEDFFHYLGKLADISGPPTRPLSNRVEAGEIAVAFQRMHAAIDDVRRLVETTVGPALRYREPIEEPTPSRGLPAGAAPGLATPSLEPESPPTESHTSPTLAVRRRARPAGTADAHSTGCGAEPPAPSSAERAPHPPEILKQLPLTPPAGLGLYRRQDYAGLPEGPRCELIRGRLYERPTISADEALVVQVFKTHLDRLANSVRGMVFRIPLAVVLADHSVVQPDLVYLSGSRRGLVQGWIEGEPDILVEVVSAASTRLDRGEKRMLYEECGVPEYWIVDPGGRGCERLVHHGGRLVPALASTQIRSPQFPRPLDLARVWREVEERTASVQRRA